MYSFILVVVLVVDVVLVLVVDVVLVLVVDVVVVLVVLFIVARLKNIITKPSKSNTAMGINARQQYLERTRQRR